jgi:beta-glucanase (GH16 family)
VNALHQPLPERRNYTRRRALQLGGALGAAALLGACSTTMTSPPDPSPGPHPSSGGPEAGGGAGQTGEWRTVWEDTFDTGTLDDRVWSTADYGGNRDLGELHHNDPSMVEIAGGNLVLHATRRSRAGYPYLAGQVSTKDKLTIGPYGRLTTRQLIGSGHGLGVGVCLYGANIDTVGWPACGEIDATEVAVARSGGPFASVHGPGYSGGSPMSGTRAGEPLVGRWAEHVLEWEPGRMSWAIDGEIYHLAEASDPRAGEGWPFDQPFFITIVMTVGSHLSGPVDESTWPQDASGVSVDPYYVLDFIRFEQRNP